MTVPSTQVQLSKGYHEYAMPLNKKAVKRALDVFYKEVNLHRTKYRIVGTRTETYGGSTDFIVCYKIL